MPQDFWLATFDDNHYCNRLDSIRFSLIIWVIICRVKIANGEFHDSHKRSSIAATVHFPETKVSTINPNIQNSPHSPKWRNMTNVIIKWTKCQKETYNLTNSKLSPIHISKNYISFNKFIWFITPTISKKWTQGFPEICHYCNVSECSVSWCDASFNGYKQRARVCKCVNEPFTNSSHFLRHYHPSSQIILLCGPIQFYLVMMIVQAPYLQWGV